MEECCHYGNLDVNSEIAEMATSLCEKDAPAWALPVDAPMYIVYTKTMDIVWDAAKGKANLAKHGVDFASVGAFDFDTALVRADTRFDYGEVRLVAMGLIGERVHVLVFTVERRCLRVISLRKAGRKEITRYVEQT